MEKIIYFDYAAEAIYGLLIISCIVRKMLKGRLNRSFFLMILVGFCATFFDIMCIALDNAGISEFAIWQYFFHTGYLFFHTLTLPIYLIFIIELTGTRYRTIANPTYKILMAIPFEAEVFILVLNLVNHTVFRISETGEYIRGKLFILNYLIAGFYLVACLIHLIRYHKTISLGKFFSIASLFPIILIAIVIQFLAPHIIIELFACSVCYLFNALIITKPEEMVDPITGLMRVSVYSERLNRSKITKGNFTIIMIELSNYRALQRALGYEAGKNLLGLVAEHLSAICKAENMKDPDLYYLENGEFRVVVPASERPVVLQTAKRIKQTLSEGFVFREVEISVLTNVCILNWPEDISDARSALLFESRLLETPYHADVMFAKEVMRRTNFDVLKSIDYLIEDALKYRKFEVYYQPIYSVKEKKFTAAEALLRLKTDEFGFISPDIFIPAAEQSGAIHRIGHYVLEEVCRFIAEDEFKDLEIECIDVNLSTIQCLEKNLAREVAMILGAYSVQPSQINLEITETATVFGESEMDANIESLSARGFTFSLDDYGTGYSNISRAINMPLSVIKLDKSITNVERNTKLYSIGENTVRMIKDMNMKIVAEGIEDKKTLQLFEEMGCDYIQGFYFSKPLPKDEFIKFILEHKGKEPEGKDYTE
jgi:EAL domain-containing protein (putative c-di-GMP-specific phosphodiesterase class I)/GGDEF domain-containing protein